MRRIASLFYEALSLFALAFLAAAVFLALSGGRDATAGAPRLELQFLVLAVWAGYFATSWLRGGQTLAMKAWRIRLVEITPGKAGLRLVLASLLVPTGVSIAWALFDRDGQFLHDRLAGTRIVLA